ncbi:MAG: GFA family protein [Caulobacter sp.]|nr:GFA family protein [Caulobacter sp.]
MPSPTLPLEGGCRCGQVRFRIAAAPMITMACHCTGCQKMSASAYSLSVMVPAEGFAVTAGEPVIGGLHGEIRHNHCPHCLSWMFTRLPRPFVNVRTTMLDDPSGFPPFIESYTSERLPWATTPAVHSFEQFPAPEDYPRLMAEYRTRT